MSTGTELARVITREVDRVADEIRAYRDEGNLWRTQGAQQNPPGTLALHLAGNLQHYIGAGLGQTGYARDRAAEFSERDVPRSILIERLTAARDTVARVLATVSEETMEAPYPFDIPPRYAGMTTRAYLIHLTWHLGWHQGQIYYHRLAMDAPASPEG